MSKQLHEIFYPDDNAHTDESSDITEDILDACMPDYIHIIEYLEEKEQENKFRNNVIFICTIIAAVFAIISAIPAISQLFT